LLPTSTWFDYSLEHCFLSHRAQNLRPTRYTDEHGHHAAWILPYAPLAAKRTPEIASQGRIYVLRGMNIFSRFGFRMCASTGSYFTPVWMFGASQKIEPQTYYMIKCAEASPDPSSAPVFVLIGESESHSIEIEVRFRFSRFSRKRRVCFRIQSRLSCSVSSSD
jgi:hypothetical protein